MQKSICKTLKLEIMKKSLFILLTMFMIVSSIEAKVNEKTIFKSGFDYYDNVVSFVERGIEFTLFLNGQFDFNTRYKNTYFDYNGQRIGRNGVKIDRNRRGRVSRVGNVYINYNFRGDVSRIGSVFVDYNRGFVTNVGDLRVKYRHGNPYFYGQVHHNNEYYYGNSGINIDISFGDVCDYNDTYFYQKDFRNNYYHVKEDANYYYYKSNPNAKIGKRSTIIKRRKPANTKSDIRNSASNTDRNFNNDSTRRSSDSFTKEDTNRDSEIKKRNNEQNINSNRRSNSTFNNENKRENSTSRVDRKNSEQTILERRKSRATEYRKRNESSKRDVKLNKKSARLEKRS